MASCDVLSMQVSRREQLTIISAKQNKGKGKSKMGAPSKNGFVFSRTPDGREICYGYNKESCEGGCGRVHVCQLRLKSHPRTKCNQVKSQKEEQKS